LLAFWRAAEESVPFDYTKAFAQQKNEYIRDAATGLVKKFNSNFANEGVSMSYSVAHEKIKNVFVGKRRNFQTTEEKNAEAGKEGEQEDEEQPKQKKKKIAAPAKAPSAKQRKVAKK